MLGFEVKSEVSGSFSGKKSYDTEKEELVALRVENEQQKRIIDKQDREIEFLREQLRFDKL